jgi:UDP-GlcNAc:undecaprenyl-phosphate GlcNAc-1-phosphate transferase
MFYFLVFILALALSAALTFLTRKVAFYFQVLDQPDSDLAGRKIHSRAMPLLGGVAIFLAYFSLLFLFSKHFLSGALTWSHLLGFFGGGLIIIIGGVLDDKYNLKPSRQIIFPLLAILAVIFGGVEIAKMTNPFGGFLNLKSLAFVSPLLIFAWLLGMMYTTKLLDGVDGLVSGLSVIASFIIFLFTLSTNYYQPDIAFAAILFSGAVAGFLIFNWHPAKIFLGEGGSLLIGYVLGVLAIISGSKIAIALLIMGIPIFDVAWTIIRRLLQGKNPFKFSDRQHLHHRLLDLGFSQRETVSFFYALSFIFGFSALFLQSRGKFLALIFLALLMFLIILFFWRLDRRSKKKAIISEKTEVKKPRLLLQVCCAPCATYVSLEILRPLYDLTWYFCNPNLEASEYQKRLEAVKFVAAKFNIPLIVETLNHESWLEQMVGRESDPEKGQRCQICYRDRLEKTAALAQKNGFQFFGTSLTISPYKDAAAIKNMALSLAVEYGLKFLPVDLRDDELFKKAQALAKELQIYRQKFCGCKYSYGYQK